MANIKISELNPLLTVEDADVLPIVDNAVTKKVTAAILRSYTQGNSVLLTGAQTVAGIKTFTSQLASSVATGTAPFSVASTTKVTNLNADLLDGLSSADFQATLSGTGIVKSTAGTISYLTDNTANWDAAYNDKINSAAVTGSGTNTLTLTQQDAGTITATWVNGTLIREIRNNTGATLTKGTIVYISGATGNKPTVSKAIATGDSTSAQTFGFVQENILNNANGYVVIIGDLIGVDTSAFTEGDQLYLSSTVAGTFTDVKQYAPNHLVYVGIVTRAHPTLGQIEVNIQNGYELDELHNVAAQSPSNGDILQYVTSTGLWTKIGGTTSAISEGSNLYFTNARSRSAISESVTGLDYNSTTGVLSTTSGYGIPTTASQTTWDTAYNDSIVSAAVTGTTTKTLTLNQQDGGSVTASWTDINTDAVSSVFGRTGAVVATSGDYTTTQVTEGTNLYFTDARSRNAISLTTTGTSGAATYSGGVLNIPNYGSALANYLPLAGGTLTGALNGTSSVFSSTITSTNGGLLLQNSAANSSVVGLITEGTWPWRKLIDTETSQNSYGEYIDGSVFYAKRIDFADRNSAISGVGTNIYTLNLATGAATFSSSVTATQLRVSNTTPLLELFNTTNGDVWSSLQAVASSGSGSDLIFSTKRNGDSLTEKLRITAAGVATFSSNVNINNAPNDADIAMTIQASAGSNKFLLFGRDSSSSAVCNISSAGAATFSSVKATTGLSLSGATAPASGIEFPSTQVASASANNLDDYEEGTWTMGVSFGGGTTGITYSNNTGTYTKIGKQVTINGYISMTNKGSSAGSARITGLPFTIGSTTGNYSSPTLRLNDITFTNQFQAFGVVNTNTINLEQISVLGVVLDLTDTNFSNPSGIILSLTYFV